jgi:site-specific DNA-cytosine methylase
VTTFASLFSGGGLADVGLRQAGLRHLWGIELDPARAAVGVANGFDVRAADVLAVDPKTLEAPDWLHASPPCTSFSQANPRAAQADGGRATELDRTLALRVVDFAAALRPLWVSVENVMGWEDTEPMRAVVAGLEGLGYMVAWWLLNAADFGTPQSRRRLFVLASRVGRPQPPASTHSRLGGLFERPWVGWEAVCDGWQDEPCRPLTDRMSATLIYSQQKNLIVNSNTKNHREKIVIDSHHRTLVAGATYAPIVDPQGVRLPSHRAPNEPGPTLTCGSCLQVVTPQGAHTLTARHVARLAGLPDDWITPSTLTMTREVCGLGVCPPVMRALALAQAAPSPKRGTP